MNTNTPVSATAVTLGAQPKTHGIATLVLLLIVTACAPFLVQAAGGNYWVRILDSALLYIMLALGLNIVVGFAGLLDLGYIAFYAAGAYLMALLGSPHLAAQFEAIQQLFPAGLHLGMVFKTRRRPGTHDGFFQRQ